MSIEELVNLIFWATMGYVYAEGLWYIASGLHHLYRQRSSTQ